MTTASTTITPQPPDWAMIPLTDAQIRYGLQRTRRILAIMANTHGRTRLQATLLPELRILEYCRNHGIGGYPATPQFCRIVTALESLTIPLPSDQREWLTNNAGCPITIKRYGKKIVATIMQHYGYTLPKSNEPLLEPLLHCMIPVENRHAVREAIVRNLLGSQSPIAPRHQNRKNQSYPLGLKAISSAEAHTIIRTELAEWLGIPSPPTPTDQWDCPTVTGQVNALSPHAIAMQRQRKGLPCQRMPITPHQ